MLDLVENLAPVKSRLSPQGLMEQVRTVMACHGAIRAHQMLTEKQIQGLLAQMDTCNNPSHCPHGRPTWVRWDLDTLEKSFKRVV